MTKKTGGLADVVACDSAITLVDGRAGRLLYRGYDVAELARRSTFEEVAYLLWHGRLPDLTEFQVFLDGFTGFMRLPVETSMILRMFPRAATPMEVLRTAVSSMGHFDPDNGAMRTDAILRKAQRITESIPLIIAAHERLRSGREPIDARPNYGIAMNFLYTLTGETPHPALARAMDAALILHADHELNASTFAARVVAATMTDIYSSITSAIAALKGPLHGGANAEVMLMLKEIERLEKGAEAAEGYILERLRTGRKIPGFGHRVYRCEDPRATVLREIAREITTMTNEPQYFKIAEAVEKVMLEHSKVFPNVDFYSAPLYHAMGLPIELFTPIFAISRAVGWSAHILEQLQNNRLIRPTAQYVGPQLTEYTDIADRA